MTAIKSKNVQALIAVGDTMGYTSYLSRVATTTQNFKSFSKVLLSKIMSFRDDTGYSVKPSGDGCLIVDELNGSGRPAQVEEFLKNVALLSRDLNSWIMNRVAVSRPDGYLFRCGYGPLLRLTRAEIIDYFGKPIVLCDRMKELHRETPNICDKSLQEMVTAKSAVSFFNLRNGVTELPKNVTHDDVRNLRGFNYER